MVTHRRYPSSRPTVRHHPAPWRPVVSPYRHYPIAHGHRPCRTYRGINIYRPYGHVYPGFGFFYTDDDAYIWLAFTAITLKILDNLNEEQQRKHEEAQIRATTAPIGETIVWSDGSVSGAVTATREGTSTSGRYCREFRQVVQIGSQEEYAYGTACQQPDGSWEIVATEP